MNMWTKSAIGILLVLGVGFGGMGWAWAQGNAGDAERIKMNTGDTDKWAVAGKPAFRDTEGHWAESAIRLAVEKGYVNGYEDGTFRPEAEVTRAEFTKLVIGALKIPVVGSASGSDWYVPYVNAAVTSEIHAWSDFTSGDWKTPMTRSEMARMAARAAGEKNSEDKKWMYLATQKGLIKGTDETGTLDEGGTTTRAQAVTIIERVLDVKAGKSLPADKYAVSRAEVLWHGTNLESMLDGIYIDVQKTRPENRFNPSLAHSEVENGDVQHWSEGPFVIDTDDSNDPYRHLLAGNEVSIFGKNREERLPIPGGAYAIVTVNHIFVRDYSGVETLSRHGYMEASTSFYYDSNNMVVDNVLHSSSAINFTRNGKSEIAFSIPSGTSNKEFVYRKGKLLPKEVVRSTFINSFNIGYHRFEDYGQKPVTVANYTLTKDASLVR
ncbi:S-layer homology domain-containing protein [Gorillibacterium sp. sgz5001074]|uniref:S-layer homology domain-containing protein n=1 Tax=Gorillibacterium sp. sgz5001074 TaxID=3446695 RepID=UPI003F67A7AC